MSIATYAGLKAAVTSWLNWSDLDSQIATFIDLAEARLNREVRHWQMDASATLSVDSQFTALPADFMEMTRVSVDGVFDPLRLVSTHVMQEERDLSGDACGTPRMYSLTNGQLEVFPTPDAATDVTVVYIARIPALVADADTNWLLTDHPDAYLYGALIHAAPYLAEDERTQTWASLYSSAIAAVNLNSDQGRYGGARRKQIRTA